MRHVMRGALAAAGFAIVLQMLPAGIAGAAGDEPATEGAETTPPPIDQEPPVSAQNTLGGGRLAAGQYRANDLVGMTVVSADGKDVGEVADFIISADGGRIDKLVIESDSIIGLDYTEFGVDWSKVKLARDADQVTLTVTQEQMTEGFKDNRNGEVQE